MIDIPISTKKTALAAFETAKNSNFATAIWRLPNQSETCVVVDFSEKLSLQTYHLEQMPNGFVFSPFENKNENGTDLLGYFIKADWSFTTSTEIQEPNFGASEKEKQFFEDLEKHLQKNTEQKTKIPSYHLTETSSLNHQNLVTRGIEAIKSGAFQKVVLSRRQEVHLKGEWQISDLFAKLCNMYPQALVSVVFIPEVGLWLGASPEILVSLDKNNIFRTMALAGTQAYNPDLDTSQAVWTQKEIEEQALVSRYIINTFKKIRLREFEEDGPKTVRAGNLIHLRTDFWVDLNEVQYPDLLTTMLRLLHPTSAVCGMPKQESLDFILKNEGYNREFYCGFLGQVNFKEETHIFVNLRCMQIANSQKAYVYAGGGITAHSNPEKEWHETIHKTQTLLRAFDS
ncbi:MAG: chorismate-binding protein [Raineya sp.]|jgi:isochorismate synthase|nr:chorismate-binding protein [Raineya sp.]